MSLHFEAHGDGEPLLLLHGGFGAGEQFAPLLPALTARRRVITVDLPGHGRTGDLGEPLRAETAADALAALDLGPADVVGYSLGGMTALRFALQHPRLVRRLVLVSVAARRAGNHPEVIATMDAMTPAAAEFLRQSPVYEQYARLAPRPQDFDLLVARMVDFLHVDYDWREAVRALQPPTLLVYADADSITPAHIVEFYALLGGGLRDANWDGSLRPTHQLAILPGTTHYDIYRSPALAPTVLGFLDEGSIGAKDSLI